MYQKFESERGGNMMEQKSSEELCSEHRTLEKVVREYIPLCCMYSLVMHTA